MVDAGIKKVIIKKASLPALDSDKVGYVFKYRIVSEDKNRTSQWSPINIVIDDSITSVSGSLQIGSNTISAVYSTALPYSIFQVRHFPSCFRGMTAAPNLAGYAGRL